MDNGSPLHHILLVDDDPNYIFFFVDAFSRYSSRYVVHTATDADAALMLLGEGSEAQPILRPSLIVLDINLPGMNGIELLSIIRSLPCCANIPVVMISTSQLDDEVEEAFRLGAVSYLLKPIDFDAHMDVVREIALLCGDDPTHEKIYHHSGEA